MSDADVTPQLPETLRANGPWLTLKEASELLGIHFTTLRKWADEGEIRVFRTPGGHRRFSLADLRRFLEERVRVDTPADTDALVNAAMVRVRAEMDKLRDGQMVWAQSLSEADRDTSRQRGRQLFTLAIAYVLKPAQRERLLVEGRTLGYAYGQEAALAGMPLVEAGRAVQFFRGQLNQIARADSGRSLDAEDVRVQQAIDHFIDEVLYAVLGGYDQHLTQMNRDAAPDSLVNPGPSSIVPTVVVD